MQLSTTSALGRGHSMSFFQWLFGTDRSQVERDRIERRRKMLQADRIRRKLAAKRDEAAANLRESLRAMSEEIGDE